jgi:peptidyl-prolyl cis-trans isomerase D
MAALGKIRSKGVILICIIGFGLFAFIAEDLFRSCETSRNNARQQVGEIYGDKISVQDFQKLIDEYTDVVKFTQGRDNLSEDELNQVKDQVWQTYVNNELIAKEADKLGLTVTDDEIQNILNEGTNQMLMQTPFRNQQTGRFDVNMLKKFLAEYKAMDGKNVPQQYMEQYQKIYNFWTFIEKTLRQQTLAQKYQSLLASCLISNPISAKASFKAKNEESSIQLASFAYNTINDKDITVSESDLKSKYDEMKEQFKQPIETRDIKYVDVQVKASNGDRASLFKDITGFRDSLSKTADVEKVVRSANSLVAYLGIPVSKNAFSQDIAGKLDSMSVGQVTNQFENKSDNTINVIKLLSKTQLPDSVQYRQIQVGGATVDAARKTADSIVTALNAGADFEALAKKYGQDGQKQWLTTSQYEHSQSVDKDTKTYITSMNTLGVNETKNLAFTNGNIILQVTDRKGMINKYDAAVIKRTIDFSKDTYNKAYNRFSQFVSQSQSLDAMQKNAGKFGYTVQDHKDLSNSEHYVAGIHSTRDAMKWIFDAKDGDVSPLYECGDNDHLLVIVMTKVHPMGYRTLDDVKDLVKAEVVKDKKAEMIENKIKGVNSVAAAKAKGGVVTAVNQITFSSPAFIQSTGAVEPSLSGAVSATASGKFCKKPVKGNNGVYVFQVVKKTIRPGKFDDKVEEQSLVQQAMQAAGRFVSELYIKAKVVDNRYLFF